ncbi:spermidine/putrescine ABC transporter substrate-binding protein [Allohahella marinimesophila]|uniref:Spermidine/putrescine ABC transporter substrate-binding protein n=1 Tax=Allohahella marinimesophila TaxID=1054972 RepID=A0ABP7PNH7_9GAMM
MFALRIPLIIVPCMVLLSLLGGPARAEATLRILIWEDFIAPELLQAWTKQTSIPVTLAYFDSDEERDSIIAERKARFDLVVVDGLSSLAFGKRDLFAGISEAEVPNLRHIDSRFSPLCKAGTGVPYLWGTLGLVYRSDKISAPDSWQDLMKPDKALQGHIGMIDDYADTFVPPLLLLGEDINSDDPAVLKSAFEMLKTQLPAVVTYEYPVTYLQTEKGQDLYLAMGYSGDQHILNEYTDGEHWAYTIPEEGSVTWVDCMAIPQNSESPDVARAFINFLNDPANAALNSEALGVATANLSAKALISPEMLADPSVFPRAKSGGALAFHGYRAVTRESLNLRKRITRALVKMHETQ